MKKSILVMMALQLVLSSMARAEEGVTAVRSDQETSQQTYFQVARDGDLLTYRKCSMTQSNCMQLIQLSVKKIEDRKDLTEIQQRLAKRKTLSIIGGSIIALGAAAAILWKGEGATIIMVPAAAVGGAVAGFVGYGVVNEVIDTIQDIDAQNEAVAEALAKVVTPFIEGEFKPLKTMREPDIRAFEARLALLSATFAAKAR